MNEFILEKGRKKLTPRIIEASHTIKVRDLSKRLVVENKRNRDLQKLADCDKYEGCSGLPISRELSKCSDRGNSSSIFLLPPLYRDNFCAHAFLIHFSRTPQQKTNVRHLQGRKMEALCANISYLFFLFEKGITLGCALS